jgi:hypothetical protein
VGKFRETLANVGIAFAFGAMLIGVGVITTGFLRDYDFATGQWTYAAATGGIVNTTTAVTIKAAGTNNTRNYVKGCQLSHATLGAATELAIRDGAGGTVLWRTLLHTTAKPVDEMIFEPPLKGTADTLLEVVTLTAVTGGVFVSCQGLTGP